MVVDRLAGLFEEEEGRFDVHCEGLVELLFTYFGDRLLDDHAHRVDGDVGTPHGGHRIGEQLLDRRSTGQVGLECGRFGTRCLDPRDRLFSGGLGRVAVVVDRDRPGPVLRELARKKSAKVLRAGGDQHDLAIDTVPGHVVFPL